MVINTIAISYVVDNGVYDFTTPPLSVEVLLPLINVFKMDLQRRISADTAPSFGEERAKQHQRHLEHCKATNTQPQQQFIDFPLPEKF